MKNINRDCKINLALSFEMEINRKCRKCKESWLLEGKMKYRTAQQLTLLILETFDY